MATKYQAFTQGKTFTQCNFDRNVYKSIKKHQNYVFELVDSGLFLCATCTFDGFNACDMKITAVMKNNEDLDEEEFYINYDYVNYDAIYYTSFAYREKCIVYALA
jgi:hypothetical protein